MDSSAHPPTISVVIPCRNEKDYIARCLESILTQEPPPGGFEIIVVDGMSEDGTRKIVAQFAKSNPSLRIIDNPEKITPCGMNRGIKAASGRWIAIAGSHTDYAPGYLKGCYETALKTGCDNVGGGMVCRGNTYLEKAIAAAHHSRFCVGGARWHNANYEGPADTVFGGVYRRDVFDRIGYFDEGLVRNQDDEFNLRLLRVGGSIWHSPHVRSYYTPRNSLSALFRQYLQYGYWKVRVIQKHRLPASPRHLVPALFVLSVFVLAPLAMFSRAALLLWLLIIAAYCAFNIVASIDAARQGGFKLLPALPAVVSSYHFSYGWGFLLGVWDFLICRKNHRASFAAITRSHKSAPAEDVEK